jgi:hypothetical protein
MRVMRNSKAFLVLILSSAGICVGQQNRSASVAAENCHEKMYRGFDSRLTTQIVARFPADVVVGFGSVAGKTIVAYPNRIMDATSNHELASVPHDSTIRELLTSPTGVRLVTNSGIEVPGRDGFEVVDPKGIPGGDRAAQDGTSSMLIAHQEAGQADFRVQTDRGARVPFVAVSGTVQKLSWTRAGMAVIVDDSLYTLAAGDSHLESTTPDPVLAHATDLCMVGPSRAVVMLPNTAVLYDHGRHTILVALSGRCSWDGNSLYLFDKTSGFVWKIDGLQNVGDPTRTATFLGELATRGASDERSFRELARFIGFDQASARTRRPNPCAIQSAAGSPEN